MARATLGPLPRAVVISGLCAIAIAITGGRARAQPAPFVAWEAPAECPGRDAFRAALDRHLAAPPARPIHVEVRIARDGSRYRLDMHTTEAESTGDRTLTGRDCALLVETAALTLALAIDPAAAPPAEDTAGDDREAPPVPNGRPPADVRAKPPERAEVGLELAARGLVTADLGSFPGVAPGAGLALTTDLGRVRLEAYGAYWLEQTARLDADPDDGAELSTLAAGLRGCVHAVGGARVGVELCASAELSRSTGRGFGGFDSRSGSYLWMSASAGPSFELKLLERLGLRVDLEAVGRPFTRPVFVFDNVDPAGEPFVVHKPAWIAGRASAGLEVSFR